MQRVRGEVAFLATLCLLGMAVLIWGTRVASAAGPRGTVQVQPVYTDNGSMANPYMVNCTSTSWTIVTSSDPVKRAQTFEWLPSTFAVTTPGVCLGFVNYGSTIIPSSFSNPNSTIPVSVGLSGISSNTVCGDGTPGIELSTANFMQYTDYGTASWSCRTRPAGNGVIKGVVDEDIQDVKGSWYFTQ